MTALGAVFPEAKKPTGSDISTAIAVPAILIARVSMRGLIHSKPRLKSGGNISVPSCQSAGNPDPQTLQIKKTGVITANNDHTRNCQRDHASSGPSFVLMLKDRVVVGRRLCHHISWKKGRRPAPASKGEKLSRTRLTDSGPSSALYRAHGRRRRLCHRSERTHRL